MIAGRKGHRDKRDDSYELLHVELRLKPFKVIEVFFPNYRTAFHFYASAMPIIALNDKIYFTFVAIPVMRYITHYGNA